MQRLALPWQSLWSFFPPPPPLRRAEGGAPMDSLQRGSAPANGIDPSVCLHPWPAASLVVLERPITRSAASLCGRRRVKRPCPARTPRTLLVQVRPDCESDQVATKSEGRRAVTRETNRRADHLYLSKLEGSRGRQDNVERL
ncbi:hypothetical protein MTO96_003717 [Rhipicephalus appendiculatus]